MLTTCILTLIMCALLFLMIWSSVCFLPWKGLMDFFPEDIKEKAKDHVQPFRTAPIFGWIFTTAEASAEKLETYINEFFHREKNPIFDTVQMKKLRESP